MNISEPHSWWAEQIEMEVVVTVQVFFCGILLSWSYNPFCTIVFVCQIQDQDQLHLTDTVAKVAQLFVVIGTKVQSPIVFFCKLMLFSINCVIVS